MSSRANIELAIDNLVLHDIDPRHAPAVRAAIERELTRLFTVHGVPEHLKAGGGLPALDAGAYTAPHGASPDVIGAGVAAALHRGMGGGGQKG